MTRARELIEQVVAGQSPTVALTEAKVVIGMQRLPRLGGYHLPIYYDAEWRAIYIGNQVFKPEEFFQRLTLPGSRAEFTLNSRGSALAQQFGVNLHEHGWGIMELGAVCDHYRADTGICRTGCPKVAVKPGNACPWSDDWEEASINCPCYR
jgi:hypothetical protein